MKKKVLSMLMAAVMALSLAACGGGTTGSGTASTGASEAGGEKVLLVGLGGDPTSFNPDANTDDYAYHVARNLYSGLLTLNNNEEIIPDLAESWEISEDNLTYTFHLRQGVKWHDGEPFTSADVKFTYEKIIEENGYLAGDLPWWTPWSAPMTTPSSSP